MYGAQPVKVFLCHKFDIGDGEFADLGEFPDVEEWASTDDDGNYLGEDPSVLSFEEPEQALDWVALDPPSLVARRPALPRR